MFFNSCVYIETRVQPLSVSDLRQSLNYHIEKPVKAHLNDGSVVLYEEGMEVLADTIRTVGIKYDISRKNSGKVNNIPLTEVASLEYYQKNFATGLSILGSTGIFFIIILMAYAAAMVGIGSMA